MSFQIFVISELSKYLKAIADEILKAIADENFESNRWRKFWKLSLTKVLAVADENFESFLNVCLPYCFCNGCSTPRANSSAQFRGWKKPSLYRRGTLKIHRLWNIFQSFRQSQRSQGFTGYKFPSFSQNLAGQM